MAFTLISGLGIGMYKEGYQKTTYRFPDGQECETHLFLNAMLECRYKEIDKIILVGTRTSSWDALLLTNTRTHEDEELWEETYEACRSEYGLQDSHIQAMEKRLSEMYKRPVVIKMHTPKLDSDTLDEVFNCYKSIANDIGETSDVLFDITHGFRSMPILLYQALHYTISNSPVPRKVEIVYGEYVKDEKTSFVRNLSAYWDYSHITDAISVFAAKLDGFMLSDILKDLWPEGSKIVKRMSEIVQTNFALQIPETIRNIKNVLKKSSSERSERFFGYDKIRELLTEISDLEGKSKARTLYNYSRYLYSKNLNTQAIITLQLTVETAVAEKYGNDDSIGNYDWWNDTERGGKYYLRQIKDNDTELKKRLQNLENFRNQIAHGGARNKYTGGFPQAANMADIYESGKTGVETLLRILEKEQT